MKLVLNVSCDNENSDAPSYGFVEILPEAARAMMSLQDAAVAFRAKMNEAGLACKYATVLVGSGGNIPCFRLMSIPLAYSEERDDGVRVLPAGFDPDSIDGDDEHRIECHRIELDDSDVRFVALDRHGSDRFTTAEIERATLEAIAAGSDTKLPLAEIEPAEAEAD